MAIDWTIKITDVLAILATLLSPFFAVWAAEKLRGLGSQQDERRKVLQVLMSTRGTRLSLDHVIALNRIDMTFPAKDYPNVADKWRLYLEHLNKSHEPTQEAFNIWDQEALRLLRGLLKEMAIALGTPFSESVLQYNIYSPIGHENRRQLQEAVQQATLQVMMGERAISVRPVDPYPPTSSSTSSN